MYEYSRGRRISRYIAGRDVWMSIKMKKSLMLINILYRMFNILQHKSSKGSLKLIL